MSDLELRGAPGSSDTPRDEAYTDTEGTQPQVLPTENMEKSQSEKQQKSAKQLIALEDTTRGDNVGRNKATDQERDNDRVDFSEVAPSQGDYTSFEVIQNESMDTSQPQDGHEASFEVIVNDTKIKSDAVDSMEAAIKTEGVDEMEVGNRVEAIPEGSGSTLVSPTAAIVRERVPGHIITLEDNVRASQQNDEATQHGHVVPGKGDLASFEILDEERMETNTGAQGNEASTEVVGDTHVDTSDHNRSDVSEKRDRLDSNMDSPKPGKIPRMEITPKKPEELDETQSGDSGGTWSGTLSQGRVYTADDYSATTPVKSPDPAAQQQTPPTYNYNAPQFGTYQTKQTNWNSAITPVKSPDPAGQQQTPPPYNYNAPQFGMPQNHQNLNKIDINVNSEKTNSSRKESTEKAENKEHFLSNYKLMKDKEDNSSGTDRVTRSQVAAQIFDFLYLGSEWNSGNLEELNGNGITHILNVTREIDNFFPAGFQYLNIREYDEETTDLLKYWNKTYNFINDAKEAGGRVLVHCKMGISRSASTVCAFAMKYFKWNLDETLEYVKARRSIVNPNSGFRHQLGVYEGILEASRHRNTYRKLHRSKSESNIKFSVEEEKSRKTSSFSPRPKSLVERVKHKFLTVPSLDKSLLEAPEGGSRPKSWSPPSKLANYLLAAAGNKDQAVACQTIKGCDTARGKEDPQEPIVCHCYSQLAHYYAHNLQHPPNVHDKCEEYQKKISLDNGANSAGKGVPRKPLGVLHRLKNITGKNKKGGSQKVEFQDSGKGSEAKKTLPNCKMSCQNTY